MEKRWTRKLNLYSWLLGALCMLSCGKDPENKLIPPRIKEISGMLNEYRLGEGEWLTIDPQIELLQGDLNQATYEWNIGGRVVSNERMLRWQCDKLGVFTGYFKVITPQEGQLKEFKLRVISPSYDRGLLLLSQVEGKTYLSFKGLDRPNEPALLNVFQANNPNAVLGDQPLSLCWTGEGITNPRNINDFGRLYIVLATDKPYKQYLVDASTMKINAEIPPSEDSGFRPKFMFSPYGGQNFLWAGENVVCLVGNGSEQLYLMGDERGYVKARRRHTLPQEAKIADVACSVITSPTDFVKVYYDTHTKRMLYVSGVGGVIEGTTDCGLNLLNLLPCGGSYADVAVDGRYEPSQVLVIGETNSKRMELLRFAPASAKSEERLIARSDVTGHIQPGSITAVHPTRPLFYYSDDQGNIFVVNYENLNFTGSPYISLGAGYKVRSMLFNPYDAHTLYIAAENVQETGPLKTAVFAYEVKNTLSGQKLFEESRLAGSLCRMVYKGNGMESLNRNP